MDEFRAFVWLRYRILSNSTRSISELLDRIVRIAFYVSLAIAALLAAPVAGYAAYRWVLDPRPQVPQLLLLGLLLFWQVAPYLHELANVVDAFDLRRYLILPIAPERIAAWNVGLALVDPMILFFIPGALAVAVGACLASLRAGLLVALTAFSFIALNTALFHLGSTARSSLRGAGRLLQVAQCLGVGGLAAAAFYGLLVARPDSWVAWVAPLLLPSGWAASGLFGAVTGDGYHGWALSLLALWGLTMVVVRLDVRWAVEQAVLGQPSGPAGYNRAGSGMPGRLRNGILGKELAYLLRSQLGRAGFFLALAPLASPIARLLQPDLPRPTPAWGLGGLALLSLIMVAQLDRYASNQWGWDGPGVRAYFTAPVTPLQVIRGKLCAALLLFGCWNGLLLLSYLPLVYAPPPLDVLFVVCAVGCLLLFHLGEGCLRSVWFARPVQMTRADIQRTRVSLLDMLVRSLTRTPSYLMLGGSALAYWSVGRIGLVALGVTMLVAVLACVWLTRVAAGMLERQPERIIDIVSKPAE